MMCFLGLIFTFVTFLSLIPLGGVIRRTWRITGPIRAGSRRGRVHVSWRRQSSHITLLGSTTLTAILDTIRWWSFTASAIFLSLAKTFAAGREELNKCSISANLSLEYFASSPSRATSSLKMATSSSLWLGIRSSKASCPYEFPCPPLWAWIPNSGTKQVENWMEDH